MDFFFSFGLSMGASRYPFTFAISFVAISSISPFCIPQKAAHVVLKLSRLIKVTSTQFVHFKSILNV